MLEFLLLSALCMIFHAYWGYPISLYLLSLFRNKDTKKQSFYPNVTFLITAFNEEKSIRKKIQNTLLLNYPKEKLQIIVASDGSTDQTGSITKEYENDGILLYESHERQGKENTQRKALNLAEGEIIVFSDVGTLLDTNGLREIVFNFADPEIGCVSSEDKLNSSNGNTPGEGIYVRYEMFLRRLESKVNSVVGLSGSFFAARKALIFKDFDDKEIVVDSDFTVLLNSIKEGMRGLSDPKAIGYYSNIANEKNEFQRKVRTILRGISAFRNCWNLLNVFKYGFFSYQLFCHKILRWAVPLFLIIAIVTNILLIEKSYFYVVLFALQFSFYATGVFGWMNFDRVNKFIFIKIPVYFAQVNISILIALYLFIKGERVCLWTPSQR